MTLADILASGTVEIIDVAGKPRRGDLKATIEYLNSEFGIEVDAFYWPWPKRKVEFRAARFSLEARRYLEQLRFG